MHLKKLLAFVVMLELAMASVAAAQETTGTIAGRLLDAQGLAVPGVTTSVTGPQGARTTVTDAEGRYTMPFLVPGTYNVKAQITGFKTVEQRDVQVQLGRTADVSATLPDCRRGRGDQRHRQRHADRSGIHHDRREHPERSTSADSDRTAFQ